MDNPTDKYINIMMSQIDEEVFLNIEEPVMDRVALSIDHSVELAKVKRRIKIGMIVSISLLIAFNIYTFSIVLNDSMRMGTNLDQYFIVSTLYSFVGLVLLFVLVEFRKRVLFLNNI